MGLYTHHFLDASVGYLDPKVTLQYFSLKNRPDFDNKIPILKSHGTIIYKLTTVHWWINMDLQMLCDFDNFGWPWPLLWPFIKLHIKWRSSRSCYIWSSVFIKLSIHPSLASYPVHMPFSHSFCEFFSVFWVIFTPLNEQDLHSMTSSAWPSSDFAKNFFLKS